MPKRISTEELYNKLGAHTVLLPITKGEKGPRIKNWPKTTYDQTTSPEWQKQLETGNVGVLLGKPSNGLCAIDCDTQDLLDELLDLNPRFRTTLVTKGARGGQIWIRIEGDYPKSMMLITEDGNSVGEWRADGNQSVAAGTHPDGMHYKFLYDHPVLTIRFEEIEWPANLNSSLKQSIWDAFEEEHGRPVEKNGSGVIINQSPMAALILRENWLVFDSDTKTFSQYNRDTGLWESKSTHEIEKLVSERLKAIANAHEKGIHSVIKNTLLSGITSILKANAVGKTIPPRPEDYAALNAIIRVHKGEVEVYDHHPQFWLTAKSEIEFDENATCPQFEKFIRSALPQEDVDLLQQYVGSIIFGDNESQKIGLFHGVSNSGKSTLLEIIQMVLGKDKCAEFRARMAGERFEASGYLNKRLLVASDVHAHFLNQEAASTVKKMTGGDSFEAEIKGGGKVKIDHPLHLIIVSNSKIEVPIQKDADAWERRFLIFEFKNAVQCRRQVSYAKKLIEEEGPGIVNWVILGGLKHALNEKEFVLTEAQTTRLKNFVYKTHSFDSFMKECVIQEVKSSVTNDELFEAYTTFCIQQGFDPLSNADFNKKAQEALERMDIKPSKSIKRQERNCRGYRGIKIRK